MNWRVVKALVAKDMALFIRNRLFAVVSVLGIVAYVAIYFVMPSSVDETLEIGLVAPGLPPFSEQLHGEQGLSIATFDSEEALKDAVVSGQYPAGVVLPQDFQARLVSGSRVRIHAFLDHSSVEVFGNDGLIAISELIFPASDSRGLALFATGGAARVVSLEVWKLRSIWP